MCETTSESPQTALCYLVTWGEKEKDAGKFREVDCRCAPLPVGLCGTWQVFRMDVDGPFWSGVSQMSVCLEVTWALC